MVRRCRLEKVLLVRIHTSRPHQSIYSVNIPSVRVFNNRNLLANQIERRQQTPSRPVLTNIEQDPHFTDDSSKPSGKSNRATPPFPPNIPPSRPTPFTILTTSRPIRPQESIIRVIMEPTFPLFRLPENVIVQVLRSMDLNQLFIISLVSTKTKNLVTSSGLKASDVDICISRRINVLARTTKSYLNLDFYKDLNDRDELLPIQRVLIQNFEVLEFGDVHSLDDMLLINCKRVDLYHPISQKLFNQFVKHWIRGSNPRLQHMTLSINKTDFVNGEVFLKGIKCMELSEDVRREIREPHSLSIYATMIQIRRRDGTPAVIGSFRSENFVYFHFIVLH